MAYYLHNAQTPGTPARAPSQPPRGRTYIRPTGGSDALARLEGSLRAVDSEIASEEANVAHHRQRESDARAELADLRRELDDFRTVARKISDEMFDLRASRQNQYYDRRQCRWCYTPSYDRNLREQRDNEESIRAAVVKGSRPSGYRTQGGPSTILSASSLPCERVRPTTRGSLVISGPNRGRLNSRQRDILDRSAQHPSR